MNLYELLSTGRNVIIRRWTEKVMGTLHPASMPRLALVDHLPIFLDEVAEAIRLHESPDRSRIAAEHGVQRLNLGFDLNSVVREYGVLRDCIIEEAAREAVAISPAERETVFDCVITGIADAVSEYQRQRDAELQRQTNEHFAFVAHELRNPLGTALSALEMLQRADKIVECRYAQILERSLKRTHDLVDSSLRIAQVGAGITVRREVVSLRSLLEDAEMAAASAAERKRVSLRVHLEEDERVSLDVRLVRSALTNLVSNAVKFTHEAGSVEVRARIEENRAVIEVEDRCGGLPPGTVERAFSPFVQLGTDRSGFGLGLSIARQAADAHGGSIRIQNLPGRGCIFVLELPTTVEGYGLPRSSSA